jgi:hypothetical protein
MLELALGLAVGIPIALLVRQLVSVKCRLLTIRATHRDEFYKLADEVLMWENISAARLRHLSDMSRLLMSRRAQFLAFKAVKELNTEEANVTPQINPMTVNLSPEKRAIWHSLYFHWLIAVCSQGSLIGLLSLLETLNFLKPEDAGERAEIVLSRELEQIPVEFTYNLHA